MSFDLDALSNAVAVHGHVARVVVAEARGSAPREAGAAMLVWQDGESGTIGGGALEWEAVARARAMLATGGTRVDRVALGPELQQCCGGAMVLVTEVFDAGIIAGIDQGAVIYARAVEAVSEPPMALKRHLSRARGTGLADGPVFTGGWMVEPLKRTQRALWIWGAGHVGRSIVAVLAPLPELAVTWVDTAESRFPDEIPSGVERLVAADPARVAAYAPQEAEHLVLTYSHALDLAICHALLLRGFAGAGLIGSATKWARFRKRLAELGHPAAEIARIECPIGDPKFGKHPQAIAISVAAAQLGRQIGQAAKDRAG